MFVTVVHSEEQLEAAINFISQNNQAFKGKKDYIRKSIKNSIHEMAEKFPDLLSLSTLGYIVIGSADEVEGIDHDANVLRIEIMVDPGLALDWEDVENIHYVQRKD
jgi:hypothetical protein